MLLVKKTLGALKQVIRKDLDHILANVLDYGTENELQLIAAGEDPDEEEGNVAVMETMLLHKSGQWICGEQPLQIAGQGNQEIGSAVTYAKRYGLCAMLGLAADEDDDSNAAAGNSVRDIAAGVGTAPAEPPKLELFDPYGEVENMYPSVAEYLSALTMKINDIGAYWPNNEALVTWIGQFYNADKDW